MPTDLPGEKVCATISPAPGSWYIAATALAEGQKDITAGLPLALTGTALPEQKKISWQFSETATDPVTLKMTVNDADLANEGRLTIGSWSAELFRGQVGPDAADHEVTYEIPRSVLVFDAPMDLVFDHTSTAGFTVKAISYSGLNESAYSNEVIKTQDTVPVPPVLAMTVECPACDSLQTQLWVGLTGEPISIRWEPADSDEVEVEILEYPPKDGAVPVASGTFTGTSWDWVPSRSELYYSRVRACTAGTCGDWTLSYEQGILFYVRLAPASGGGIGDF